MERHGDGDGEQVKSSSSMSSPQRRPHVLPRIHLILLPRLFLTLLTTHESLSRSQPTFIRTRASAARTTHTAIASFLGTLAPGLAFLPRKPNFW
jgi:hypothetical protein